MNRLLLTSLIGIPILWVLASINPGFWVMVPVFAAPLIWVGYRYCITMGFIRKNRKTLEMLDQELEKGTFDND